MIECPTSNEILTPGIDVIRNIVYPKRNASVDMLKGWIGPLLPNANEHAHFIDISVAGLFCTEHAHVRVDGPYSAKFSAGFTK
jgi:hypothetical protein